MPRAIVCQNNRPGQFVFCAECLSLFHDKIIDHIADTLIADRVGIERKLVVGTRGGIFGNFKAEFPMSPIVARV